MANDFTIGNYVDSYLEYLAKGGALLGRGELIEMFKGNKHTDNFFSAVLV